LLLMVKFTMDQALVPNYEGPPNENINIWRFGQGDSFFFVRGVALDKQQAYGLLDIIANSGRDPMLRRNMSDYGYFGRPFEEIVILRDSGDDDANDFLSTLETIRVSETCYLYIDKLSRRGIDGEGPVILGYGLAEIHSSTDNLYVENFLVRGLTIPNTGADNQYKKAALRACLAELGLLADQPLEVYVINSK